MLNNGLQYAIESTLKYGRYLNIDDGWKMVAISTLNQRWNTVDTSTLTMVETWLSVWCFHDFEIIILSCLFASPHSFYWITINA